MDFDLRQFINDNFNGNLTAFAREFGVTPGAVHYWLKSGLTPQRIAQFRLWALEVPRASEPAGGEPQAAA